MEINWLSAFIDLPSAHFESGTTFWSAVTKTTVSAGRGADDEFATLLPADGDAHLRVQRVADGLGGTHLDLHVPSVTAARSEAETLGARAVPGHDVDRPYVTMTSPGGMVFCFVSHHGESMPCPPVAEPAPHRVDQVSIDLAPAAFDQEVDFWAELTGWQTVASRLDEFVALVRPPQIPIRILLQRLDDNGPTRAHVDIACGSAVETIVDTHIGLGAEVVGRWEFWTTMRDPTGRLYCLTRRDPLAGVLA